MSGSPSSLVNVHVVPERNSCQAAPMSPTIPAHEPRDPLIPRGVGTHPARSAGVYPGARNSRGGVGGNHRALGGGRLAVGGRRSTVAGAGTVALAHLVAAPVERSAPGPGPTATSRPQWAPARWTTRSPRADTPVGASGSAGRGDPSQTWAVPSLTASLAQGR
jgi:hypothetical protein